MRTSCDVASPAANFSRLWPSAVTAEGYSLLKFAASDAASHDVRINAPA